MPKAERIRAERQLRTRGAAREGREWEAHPDAEDGPSARPRRPPLPAEPVVYDRGRAEALWDFRYRLGVFRARRRSASTATTSCRSSSPTASPGAPSRFDRTTGTLELLGAWGDTSRLDEALEDLATWLGTASISR